jgi:hypothetical protein
LEQSDVKEIVRWTWALLISAAAEQTRADIKEKMEEWSKR